MILKDQRSNIQVKIYSAFVLAILFISGCGFSESLEESNNVMDNFFNDRIENKHNGAEKFYSQAFLDKVGSEEWNRIKTLVEKANGNLLSYEQSSWNIKKRANTKPNESGTFVYYLFMTTYENGQGTEAITVLKNKENPNYKIISHNFNSEMIQKMINQGIENITETDSL